MNKVKEIFSNLTMEELIEAIKEIKEDSYRNDGVIKEDGWVRKIAKEIEDVTNIASSFHLTSSIVSLQQEAAFRWVGIIEVLNNTKNENSI